MSYDIKQYSEEFLMTYAGTEIGDFITNIIEGATKSNITTLEYIKMQLDIDTATGIWLDYIGLKIGVERPYLVDTSVPIFALNISKFAPGTATLGGFGVGYFINGVSSGGAVPLPDNLYRERIKIVNAINHSTVTYDLLLEQIKFITPKIPQITTIEVGRVIVTFGEELGIYEKYLFETGYVVVSAGVELTVEDSTGIIIGEPTLGFGSYFADYVAESGLPLPIFTLQ